MHEKTSYRKSKIVQRKNPIDETLVRIVSSRELPEIEGNVKFPHLPVQTGLKNIIIDIMESLVVMENINNVHARESPALLCYIANELFGQQWLFEKVEEGNTNDIEIDHDNEELSPAIKRKQKQTGHLDFVLPTRKSIGKIVPEFSLTCIASASQKL